MNKQLRLFWRFARIGVMSFGGGYTMLPLMERELIEAEGWITREDLLDYYAVAQCTPGIIAVNTATFVGRKVGGFWGAVLATVGVVTPSLIIIMAVASVLTRFMHLRAVIWALAGIRIAVAGLMIGVCVDLVKKSVKSWPAALLCALTFVLMTLFSVSPVWYVLGGAAVGLLTMAFAGGKKGGKPASPDDAKTPEDGPEGGERLG